MARLRLELLGGFAASLEEGRPFVLPTRKSQALLAYLAVSAGRFHTRDKLTALLWGDTAEAQARQSFRQALASLRRAMGAAASSLLLIQGDAVALNAAAVTVDVALLQAALTETETERLEQAAALYRGDFLDGLRVDEPAFEEWRGVERERLHALGLEVLNRLLQAQLAGPATDSAVQTALRLLAIDPSQEPVHRTLMRLLLQQGRRAAALKQYQGCVEWLARELGAEPEEATRALYREILRTAAMPAESRPGAAMRPIVAAGAGAEEAPMVGRDKEAGRLREALADMLDGGGQVVLVRGEAGIGKSRLLRDFAAEAAASGVQVLLGRCHETEQVLPLHAWIDALRGDQAILEANLRDRLGAAASAQLGRVFPELRQSGAEPVTVAPQHALLFDALVLLLAELSAARPVVFLLEDLHWVDGLSARFLAYLGRRIGRFPVLVVGSLRPEELADAPVLAQSVKELRTEGAMLEISLGPLSEPDSLGLARALRPAGRANPQWDRIAADIWTVSEGNPFVIVESIRALQGGAAADGTAESPLSVGIRGLVIGRLERLEPLPLQVVSVAAAIGRNFSFALLARASGKGELDAANVVEELVRRQFLAADGDRLDFCHDWIRQVAYERLLPQRRALLHAAISEALEALHPNDSDEIADQLGHHFARAGDAGKAIHWLIRFHQLASRRDALEDALRALQQAIAVAGQLPALERDRQRLDLALRQAFVMSILGRQQEIWELLQGQAGHLERIADPRLTSEYHSRLGLTCFFLGKRAEGQVAAERGLMEGERAGDPECIGKALHVLSLNAFEAGRPQAGIAHARRAIPLFDQPHNRQWLGLVYHDLALNCLIAGALDAALDAAGREDAVGRAAEWPRVQVLAGSATVWALALRGDGELAVEAARRSLALSRDPMASALVSGSLGLALTELGDGPGAVKVLVEVVAQLRQSPVRSGEARHLAFLSDAYLLAGDIVRAKETAERGIDLCQADGMLFNLGMAQRSLGRIALAQGHMQEAGSRLAGALATFLNCQAAFEAARTHADLATAGAGEHDLTAARQHLVAARHGFELAQAPKRIAALRPLADSLGIALAEA